MFSIVLFASVKKKAVRHIHDMYVCKIYLALVKNVIITILVFMILI